MKWLSIKTWKNECQYLSNWHRWFAWYPVEIKTLPDGSVIRAWLTTVNRKGTSDMWGYDVWWTWEYKEAPND
jgi:hypothetical protein